MILFPPSTWQRPRCRRLYLMRQTSRYAVASYVYTDQSGRPLPAIHRFHRILSCLHAPAELPQDAKHFFPAGPNMGDSDMATAT